MARLIVVHRSFLSPTHRYVVQDLNFAASLSYESSISYQDHYFLVESRSPKSSRFRFSPEELGPTGFSFFPNTPPH